MIEKLQKDLLLTIDQAFQSYLDGFFTVGELKHKIMLSVIATAEQLDRIG